MNLEVGYKLIRTSNCINKCSHLFRLKIVSVSNFKLESGEMGWSNKVYGTEGWLEWV